MYLNNQVVPHTKHKNQLVKAVQGNSRCLFEDQDFTEMCRMSRT